jgi:hypothetical protein
MCKVFKQTGISFQLLFNDSDVNLYIYAASIVLPNRHERSEGQGRRGEIIVDSNIPRPRTGILQHEFAHMLLKIHISLQSGLFKSCNTILDYGPIEIGDERGKAFIPLCCRRKSRLRVDDSLCGCNAFVVPRCDSAGELVDKLLELCIGDCTVEPCPSDLIRYYVDTAMTSKRCTKDVTHIHNVQLSRHRYHQPQSPSRALAIDQPVWAANPIHRRREQRLEKRTQVNM